MMETTGSAASTWRPLLPQGSRPLGHPLDTLMVKTAIWERKEEGGSTMEAISLHIRAAATTKFALPQLHDRYVRHYLGLLLERREIVEVSPGRYALPSPEEIDKLTPTFVKKYAFPIYRQLALYATRDRSPHGGGSASSLEAPNDVAKEECGASALSQEQEEKASSPDRVNGLMLFKIDEAASHEKPPKPMISRELGGVEGHGSLLVAPPANCSIVQEKGQTDRARVSSQGREDHAELNGTEGHGAEMMGVHVHSSVCSAHGPRSAAIRYPKPPDMRLPPRAMKKLLRYPKHTHEGKTWVQ